MNYIVKIDGYYIRINSDISFDKNNIVQLCGGKYCLKSHYDISTLSDIVARAESQADSCFARTHDDEDIASQRIYDLYFECTKADPFPRNDLIGRAFVLDLDISKDGSVVATVLSTTKYVCAVGIDDFVEPYGPVEMSDIMTYCEDNSIEIPKILYQVVV
jgi:hypothetical protein